MTPSQIPSRLLQEFLAICKAAELVEGDRRTRLAEWLREIATEMEVIGELAPVFEPGFTGQKIRLMAEEVYARLERLGFDFVPGPSQYPTDYDARRYIHQVARFANLVDGTHQEIALAHPVSPGTGEAAGVTPDPGRRFTPCEQWVLDQLTDRDERMTQNAMTSLSKSVGHGKSTVTKAIARLKKEGLLTNERNDTGDGKGHGYGLASWNINNKC